MSAAQKFSIVAVVAAILVVGTLPVEVMASSCTMWDVRDICCPSACAAKKSSRWAQADEVLRSCMKGLGCSDGEVSGSTVFMKCDCK